MGVHGLLNVRLHPGLPKSVCRNLCLLEPFVGKPEAQDAPTLHIHSSAKEPSPSKGMARIDNFYYIDEDRLIEKSQYKWSRWTCELTGIATMRDVHLTVSGDLYSGWVWPYRTLSAVLRMALGYHGGLLLHAAGYARSGGGATLVLAPSGTGKTLTSLHWLCDGRSYYGDDSVLLADGRLHAMNTRINYWPHRYQGHDVLPQGFPALQIKEKRRLAFNRVLQRMTGGQVGFGTRLDADTYWPGCVAEPRPVDRLVVLHKAERFGIDEACDQTALRNRIIADLRYQGLSVLRWALCARLAEPSLWLSQWEARVGLQVDRLLDSTRIISVGVPARYSDRVYAELREVIA